MIIKLFNTIHFQILIQPIYLIIIIKSKFSQYVYY